MALEFIDSFAHSGEGPAAIDTFLKWTNGLNAGLYTTSPVRSSGHAITLIGEIHKTLKEYKNFRVAGVAYYYPATSTRGTPLMFLSGGLQIITLIIEADNTLSVYSGRLIINSSYIVTGDVYHYYEMSISLSGSNPLNVDVIVHVDGHEVINTSGASSFTASQLLVQSALMNGVGLGGALGGGNIAYACDFYCLNSDGTDILGFPTTNVNFLGDISVFALVPVQDVTVTWQPFGGSGTDSFSCINEIPPDDDTSYVFTDTVGQKETFLFQPILGFTGTIFGAQLLVYAKKDAEGSRAFQPVIGGNPFDVDTYLGDYYDYYLWPLDTNVGLVWTPTNFNSQNFGAELTV
jgi:hypothetical protein